jgi:nucleotide-binding universal stress UspA family protein
MQLAFKTIAVATDFEDAAQLALEYAAVLARKFGAGLRVLHIVEPPRMLGNEFGVPDVGVLTDQAIEKAQARLSETLATVPNDDVIGQVLVGHAAQKIVEYAADHAVDLVVMGTHGRGAVAHLFVGSVAERVVRTAPCPVLTVRDSEALQHVSARRSAAAIERHL